MISFSIARALMLCFTFAKRLEQLFFFFFWNDHCNEITTFGIRNELRGKVKTNYSSNIELKLKYRKVAKPETFFFR